MICSNSDFAILSHCCHGEHLQMLSILSTDCSIQEWVHLPWPTITDQLRNCICLYSGSELSLQPQNENGMFGSKKKKPGTKMGSWVLLITKHDWLLVIHGFQQSQNSNVRICCPWFPTSPEIHPLIISKKQPRMEPVLLRLSILLCHPHQTWNEGNEKTWSESPSLSGRIPSSTIGPCFNLFQQNGRSPVTQVKWSLFTEVPLHLP